LGSVVGESGSAVRKVVLVVLQGAFWL
jgi:hypothetical protein